MKLMNTFFTDIENALSEYAEPFTPEGSEVKAVVHQWLHAIAYNNPLFASDKGADKALIIKKLKKAECYTTATTFKKTLRENINFNPKPKPDFTFIDLFAGIGGMRLGFESAGGSCVFSKFERNAQDIFLKHARRSLN